MQLQIQAGTRSQGPGTAGTADNPFEIDARASLERLRGAIDAATSACGARGLNSLQLSRKLSIDKSLAWRIARFAQYEDVLLGSRHLPGDAGLRIFVRAVRARGGSDAAGELVRAIDGFDAVVRDHAGSRHAFRALVANCVAGPVDECGSEYRKAAFQANAAVWGIQARARVVLTFLTKDDRGGTDLSMVSGFVGLRRNRRDLSWPVVRRRIVGEGGRDRSAEPRPLDPACPADAPPILAEHSTLPGESLRPITTEHGHWYELPQGELGAAGAVDLFFGEHCPGARHAPVRGIAPPTETLVRLDVPAENVIVDLFVDRALALDALPSAELLGLLAGGTGESVADREWQRMTLAERPEEIGNEPRHWTTPANPRHWELVHDCMRWLDRRPASFRTFRLNMAWPPIPTALVLSTPIAGR
jgi:hypothetical protein